MTTDTKAVARWVRDYNEMWKHTAGDYVLFTDHEQVVAELEAEVTRFSKFYAEAIEQIAEIATERQAALSALAAKSAEVEGLRAGIEKALDEIEDDGPKALKYAAQELRAAMEKSND
jgi:hypothetical protein